MSTQLKVEVPLDFWTCIFLKSSFHTLLKYPYPSSEANGTSPEIHEFTCYTHGTFLFGAAGGPPFFLFFSTISILLALYGVATNILNVILLRKSFHGRRHFKHSLLLLAVVELLVSIAAVGLTVLTIFIMDNVTRSEATFTFFLGFVHVFYMTRTISTALTILITLERFLIVTYPNKFNWWLRDEHPWKSRIPLLIPVVIAFSIQFPWMIGSTVAKNEFDVEPLLWKDDATTTSGFDELKNFPYFVKTTELGLELSQDFLLTIVALDFLGPVPILLALNALLYRSIRSWSKKRSVLSGPKTPDLNAAKMFAFVTLVALCCNFVSCSVWIASRFLEETFIELILLERFSIVVSTSTNFIIYYCFGPGFKREFWKYLSSFVGNESYLRERIDKHLHLDNGKDEMTTVTSQQQSTQQEQVV